jgi:hypothetical protein
VDLSSDRLLMMMMMTELATSHFSETYLVTLHDAFGVAFLHQCQIKLTLFYRFTLSKASGLILGYTNCVLVYGITYA